MKSPLKKTNLKKILNKFKLQELRNFVLFQFPETTWEYIENRIKEQRNNITKQTIIQVFVSLARNLDDEEFETRISNLNLLAVERSKSKIWYAYEMLNKEYNITIDLLESIKKAARRNDLSVEVQVFKTGSKIMLSIAKKVLRKQKGIKTQQSIYFQYFSNTPYLFSSNRATNIKLLESITNGLGYKTFKKCYLSGSQVLDLLKLLKNKEQKVRSATILDAKPKLKINSVKNNDIIDYTNTVNRKNFAHGLYGDDPPQSENLTVTVKRAKWEIVDDFDKMKDTSLKGIKMNIQAPNIIECFRELITMGAVSDPIPEYMRSALITGKNDIKIARIN